MFEVLRFLFERYISKNIVYYGDNKMIARELEKIGFKRCEINRALHWIEGFAHVQETVKKQLINPHAVRHYLPEEAEQLGLEGQDLLLHMERFNILDPVTREIVIDRVMALDPSEVSLARIRWITLMALLNQPEKQSAIASLQDMILANTLNVLH